MIRWLLMFLAVFFNANIVQADVWNNIVNKFQGRRSVEAPSLKVLITHDVEKARVDVTGKYSLFDPNDSSYYSYRHAGKSRDFQPMSDGLRWGEVFPGRYQLKIQPEDSSVIVRVDGNEYPGSIYIYDIGNSISIINQVPVEDYIRYIVAESNENSLHPEVLAAIAIVARTNAYYQASNPKNQYWTVDGSKVGYRGRYPVSRQIDNAVNATRYMIMSRTGVYEKTATPFAAQFDSNSPKATLRDAEASKISLAEANEMAKRGEHAAQILARAFPGSTIMLMQYSY